MTEFENQEALTDAEKEKAYREAVGYLSSSLTNDELIEQSLSVLLSGRKICASAKAKG